VADEGRAQHHTSGEEQQRGFGEGMGAMAAAVEVRQRQGRVGNTAAVEVQSLRIFVFLHTFTLLQYVTYVFIIFRMEHKICKINKCLNVFMFLGMLQ
jgi:hypothetical protein